jgi:RNA recognition motif-containing protein
VSVRLLTDKHSGKSRGMAFVDVATPQQLVRALRLHHSRLQGRAINVERTVGGGGNNDKRKAKLEELRSFQGTKVRRDVQALVDEFLLQSRVRVAQRDAPVCV